jgi:hypothetical protein
MALANNLHQPAVDENVVKGIARYRAIGGWNLFAKEILRVNLDPEQRAILDSVQKNRRTTVRSGHARGKDFVAAVACICFLYLHYPSKVVCTAPTERQVKKVMIAEISSVRQGAAYPLGGNLYSMGINFPKQQDDWYLIGFKADDKELEKWTGYHSQNLLLVFTEASGMGDLVYGAAEGLLTGNSRFLTVGNPNRLTGMFAQSFRDKRWAKFNLNCMEAPNVKGKKALIQGQVDYAWVNEKIGRPGWTREIKKEEFRKDLYDFEWHGLYYRPSNIFRVKVQGEFPEEDESQLIPMAWVEAAFERWDAWSAAGRPSVSGVERYIGADIGGMGNDLTVFAHRSGNIVERLRVLDTNSHMEACGALVNESRAIADEHTICVDTIGEGAGVYSRLEELRASKRLPSPCEIASAKFSESAKDLTDITGEREFLNIRAWCHWALRDALDPQHDAKLALPPSQELLEDLTASEWHVKSNGKIFIEPKEDIKQRLGRSPDRGDAVALTFYKVPRKQMFAFGGFDAMPSMN